MKISEKEKKEMVKFANGSLKDIAEIKNGLIIRLTKWFGKNYKEKENGEPYVEFEHKFVGLDDVPYSYLVKVESGFALSNTLIDYEDIKELADEVSAEEIVGLVLYCLGKE